ncbi:helicase-associated domain-containing protein [bacterium]|nr:helicase-associated domain-containing protein [bacterium]
MTERKMDATRLAQWREAMLAETSVSLRALASNYLGAAGEKLDKPKLVGAIAAMLDDPEAQRTAVAMMDRLDALIVGTVSLAGATSEAWLRDLLVGELSFHELEYRLANLGERLLLFATQDGRWAVNPHFDAAVRAGAARADILFGAAAEEEARIAAGTPPAGGAQGAEGAEALGGVRPRIMPIQELALVAYGLLRDCREPLLKDGRLAAKLRRRLAALCPGDPGAVGAVEAIVNALLAAGIASRDDEGVAVNFRAFAELLCAHREDLAFALAGMLSGRPGKTRSLAAAEACRPFLDRGFVFSCAGLRRFIRFMPGEAAGGPPGADAQAAPAPVPGVEAYADALERLGLVEREAGAFRCEPERALCPWRAASQEACASVDGSGAIHILPSASLRDIVELLDIGVLKSASGAWTIGLTRESARRAFTAGKTVEDIGRMLERMSGRSLPQAIAFDLRMWEDEYEAIKLYRGYLLSVDAASARIIEQSGLLSRLPNEAIGEGLYYFGNVSGATIEKALADSGLPPPALRSSVRQAQARSHQKSASGEAKAPGQTALEHEPREAARGTEAPRSGDGSKAPAAKGHDAGLRAAFAYLAEGLPASGGGGSPALPAGELARMNLPPGLRKKLEERVRRKLIYTAGQLRAIVESEGGAGGRKALSADFGLSAKGLDFPGKLRVIQAALKATYSRLDIRWSSEGEIRSCALRPTSLRKTEKDYVLEGEDVSSGDPLSIRVGSMIQVSLRKGYLLGDE